MRINFLILIHIVISFTAFGQAEITRMDSGKCYAKCGAPAIYRIENIKAVDQPKHKKTVNVPQSFMVSTDTIQYASGDSVWQTLPGIYNVKEEMIMLGSGREKIISTYTVVQEPRHEFTRNQKKFKQVAVYEAADLPSKKKIEFPATYTNVSLKKLVVPDEKELEIEVLCPEKLTEKIIDEVQLKLKGLGFAADNFANELGETTLDSLKKFQEQNELPIGGLNIPTLQLLGIQY